MISTIRLSYGGLVRRKRHRSFDDAVFVEDAFVEIAERSEADAPVFMWAVTPDRPLAGRRCIRVLDGALWEPVLVDAVPGCVAAADVFDATGRGPLRGKAMPATASAPEKTMFVHRRSFRTVAGSPPSPATLVRTTGVPQDLLYRAQIVDGRIGDDVAEVDRSDREAALTDVQEHVAASYVSIGGVLMRRSEPSILRWAYGAMGVERINYRNYAGGVPTMRPFDPDLCRRTIRFDKTEMLVEDISVRIVGPGPELADERPTVLAGIGQALVASLEKDIAASRTDARDCATLVGLRDRIRRTPEADTGRLVGELASGEACDLSRFDELRREAASASAAIRWFEVGRTSEAPKATVDRLQLATRSYFSATLAEKAGERNVPVQVFRSVAVRKGSSDDHPVVAVLPSSDKIGASRVEIRHRDGRFYLPVGSAGVRVEQRGVRKVWEDSIRHVVSEDMWRATGLDLRWHGSDAVRDSDRHHMAPFASVERLHVGEDDAVERFACDLVAIDGVVHREIPEPCIVTKDQYSGEPKVAIGWKDVAVGGAIDEICWSLREIGAVVERAEERSVDWSGSKLSEIDVVHPEAFSADMRSRRADMIGRRVVRVLVRNLPSLETDTVVSMAELRSKLAPAGRPDLADGTDAVSVLDLVAALSNDFCVFDTGAYSTGATDAQVFASVIAFDSGSAPVVSGTGDDAALSMGM